MIDALLSTANQIAESLNGVEAAIICAAVIIFFGLIVNGMFSN